MRIPSFIGRWLHQRCLFDSKGMGAEGVVIWSVVVLLGAIHSPVFGCPGIATNEVHMDCEEYSKNAAIKVKPTASMTEYFKEHEVSEKDSRMALQALDLDEINKVPAWCDEECGIDKIHFCQSAAFINDHCCCEHRHAKEKLPWIPHTCYLGKERCQPHTSSCSKYREIRECCCDRLLIAQYIAKFSTGTPTCSRLHMASWVVSLVVTAISAVTRFS